MTTRKIKTVPPVPFSVSEWQYNYCKQYLSGNVGNEFGELCRTYINEVQKVVGWDAIHGSGTQRKSDQYIFDKFSQHVVDNAVVS